MTKLHIAVKKSCLETVQLLLQSNESADITTADSKGNTPLHLAFNNKSYVIVDLLLSVTNIAISNPTNNQGLSHFHIACTRNNVKIVKNFIENGVNLNTCVGRNSNLASYSPLHFAISHNRSKIVKLLLNNGANAGVKDNKGFTPLHLACYYTSDMFSEVITNIISNSSIREQISKQKLDTSVSKLANKFSQSARKIYWLPNRKDYLEIMNLLLNSNESDLNSSDRQGNTPIFYACSAVHEMNYRLLKNSFRCSQTLWAEIVASLSEELYERRKVILNHLVKLDVNLDTCYHNYSILHYICRNYHVYSNELMELFLRKGANPNVEDQVELTPLILACRIRRKILTRTLLNHGADVNCIDPSDNSTPLMIIAFSSNLKPHDSIYDADIFQMLISRGANVNARRYNGRTALHALALVDGALNLSSNVSALIKAGADINCRDSDGLTALHIACERSEFNAVDILLKYGADVNVEDNKGRSVCCYFYEYLINTSFNENTKSTMKILQKLVITMNILESPVSEKVFNSSLKFDMIQPLNDNEKIELVEQCQREVLLLKGTQIHDRCTLYDVVFRNENALSQLVKNPVFQTIVKSVSFNDEYPHYNYYINLNYEAGVVRGELLPKAKLVLNKLAQIHLPDTCSENICKYFTNHELKESIANLHEVLDMNLSNTGNNQLMKSSRSNKRQKND